MSEKLTKFRKFTRYLPENTRTLHDVCPKNIFPEIWGEGHVRRPTCLRAGKFADLPMSFDNSFRRILIHRHYGFLPFRRSLSPKIA